MVTLLALVCGLALGILIGLFIERAKSRQLQTALSLAEREQARLQAVAEAMRVQSEQDARLLKQAEEERRQQAEVMKSEFRNLANELLEAKTASLKQANVEQLTAVLTPLKENIEQLGKSVVEGRIAGVQQKESVEHAIRNLMEKAERIGEDAVNLTKALKANPKVQGDWGEMILERMLEESGLRRGEEYFIQENCITEDGRNVRPDVIVRFPEKRSVIIDSKVSFTAYVNYINAVSPDEQAQALSAHLLSMREHINELAGKDYSKVVKDSIGYVLMFVPNEGAYLSLIHI